jgi:hypothetical protein
MSLNYWKKNTLLGKKTSTEYRMKADVGYTEYRLPNRNIVGHPNLRSEGPFYDWCIIPNPNDEYDYAVQHLIQNKRKVPDHFLRCPRLSKVEEKWGRHVLPLSSYW